MNDFTITILPSGSVKIDTGSFSGPVHATAEAAMMFLCKELGGEVSRTRATVSHVHNHDHNHDHNHQ